MKYSLSLCLVVAVAASLLLAGCGSGDKTPAAQPLAPGVLQTILVSRMETPQLGLAPAGSTMQTIKTQFYASGLYTNLTSPDITASCTWASSDPSVGTIDNTGKFTLLKAGTTTISASMDGHTGTQTIYTHVIDYTPGGVPSSCCWYGTSPITRFGISTDGNSTWAAY